MYVRINQSEKNEGDAAQLYSAEYHIVRVRHVAAFTQYKAFGITREEEEMNDECMDEMK